MKIEKIQNQSNRKLFLDEWIVREVIDTLYMVRTTLLGITGLDSPREVAKKSANETAITRRINKAIDIIQQSEQPKADLGAEIDAVWNPRFNLGWDEHSCLTMNRAGFTSIARHFAEWGAIHFNARKEE